MDAALKQLGANRAFSNLSLREVTRDAGIAPTSFYRHFDEMNELGLALVDEAGVALRQMMRKARLRIEKSGGAIDTSVDTFMEYMDNYSNHFRLLLRERTGVSTEFRTAIRAEIQHFITELAEDMKIRGELSNRPVSDPQLVSEATVVIVFNLGAEALDVSPKEKLAIADKIKRQLRMLMIGAEVLAHKPS